MKILFILVLVVFSSIYPAVAADEKGQSGISTDTLISQMFTPDYTYEYIPDVTYDLIEDRIACLETDITLSYNPRVKSFIDYFTVRDRGYTRMMIQRMHLYFPLFEKYLKKHNLPLDLKYLAIVESGLNPRAVSRVGATGLWQFMPATGRSFKLHQDWYIDERMDPEKATEAACLYLKQLYNMFGDWELALASYNAGPGNVRRAVRRSGYKDSFWEVYDYLPRETRSYVPQFIAIAYVMNYAEEHNLLEDRLQYAMMTDTIVVNQYLDLETLANQINVCPEDLHNLNPELKRNAVPGEAKGYVLNVPLDKYEFINDNRMALLDSAGKVGKERLEYIARNTVGSTYNKEKIVYKVQRGDVLGKIAGRYGVGIADLRKWNNINGNLIRAGQNLTIYVKPNSTSLSNQLAQKSTNKPVPMPNDHVYLVQPGDTLWAISQKYDNLTIEQIKKLNNLTSNNIKPGQRLVLSQ